MQIDSVEKADIVRMKLPRTVQELIPIDRLHESGMAKHPGQRYSVVYEMKDIDYQSAGDEARENIFGLWSEVLNSFDTQASYKITICNHRINTKETLSQTLLPVDVCDGYDGLRAAYNALRYEDIQGEKGYVTDKYLTVSTYRSKEEKANSFFRRFGADMNRRLSVFDSGIRQLLPEKRVEIYYDFFHAGREASYNFRWMNEKERKRFKNYACPDMFRTHSSYFEIGARVGRCMMLKTFGGSLKDEFFTRLATEKTDLMLSADIIPVSNADARKLIELKDDTVEAAAHAWSSKSSIKDGSAIRLPRQVKKDRKIIDEYIEDMDENNQKMFLVQIVLCFLADDLDALEDFTETVNETAAEFNSQMTVLYEQQMEGLQDALPFGVRRIEYLRDCNTDTTAILMPFSDVKVNHNTGIPYGRHEGSLQQQMVDRRKLKNGHEWILGTSGSGKSTNAKLKLVYEALLTDSDIIVCDPDGEYAPLIQALGGQIICVGRDSINIADISQEYGDEDDPVQKKSNLIISFFEAILDESTLFGETEKSLVDRALRELYASDYSDFTLSDVYDLLTQYTVPAAANLALALERHIRGSFNCFAKPTDVQVAARIVCYDLSTLPKQMKDAGMLVVLDHIDHRLIKNRGRGRATMIKLDEMDYYFKHRSSIGVIEDFFQRARKYGGFITAIIQNISKVLEIPEARTMISNSANTVMLQQETLDAAKLAEMYGLSSIQVKTLQTAERGHGINKIGNIIYAFDGTIPESNDLYKLIDTTIVSG